MAWRVCSWLPCDFQALFLHFKDVVHEPAERVSEETVALVFALVQGCKGQKGCVDAQGRLIENAFSSRTPFREVSGWGCWPRLPGAPM